MTKKSVIEQYNQQCQRSLDKNGDACHPANVVTLTLTSALLELYERIEKLERDRDNA